MVRRKRKKYDQLQKEGIDSRKRPGWARYLVLGMVLAMVMAAMAGCGRKPQDNAALAAFCPNGEKHEFDVETTHADCTQRGYTTGTCQKCGYTYMYDIVNALGHQWEEPVSLKTVSCTEDGVQSRSCSRCGIRKTAVSGFPGSAAKEPPESSDSGGFSMAGVHRGYGTVNPIMEEMPKSGSKTGTAFLNLWR